MSFGSSYSRYEPFDHREVANPTSNLETYIHLLKGCLGTGILAMPDAFRNAGLLLGTIGTIVMGIICTYGVHVLMKCQYTLCKRMKVPLLTYPQAMKTALEHGPPCLRCLAPIISMSVDFFIVMYQFGICCVYIVFVSNSIKEISDHYWIDIDVRIIMVVITFPFMLLTFMRNLKMLSPFSTLANVITFLGLGFIIYYIFWPSLPKISSVPLFGEPKNFALFFGTVLFSLEAIGVVVAIEANMATPQAFMGCFGVLNQGMGTVTFLYLVFGFIGYIKYGTAVKGSISLNLPHGEFIAQCVIIAFAFAIYFSFALQFYVMFEIVWNTWIKHVFDESKLTIFEFVTRIAFVILALLAGLAVPLLGLFISLFGALCLPILGFSFPGLMEYAVIWADGKAKTTTVVKDFVLILFGIVSTVIAVSITLVEIVTELSKPVEASKS